MNGGRTTRGFAQVGQTEKTSAFVAAIISRSGQTEFYQQTNK